MTEADEQKWNAWRNRTPELVNFGDFGASWKAHPELRSGLGPTYKDILDFIGNERKTNVRDDLETPHDCKADYLTTSAGADLNEVESFTTELTGIVDKMKQDLATEVPLFAGVDIPNYTTLLQNELSHLKEVEQQWMTGSVSGSWTTNPTPICEGVSSNSLCSVNDSSQILVMDAFGDAFLKWRAASLKATSESCGTETETTNESSECMVPMTNEQTPGTPSEAK